MVIRICSTGNRNTEIRCNKHKTDVTWLTISLIIILILNIWAVAKSTSRTIYNAMPNTMSLFILSLSSNIELAAGPVCRTHSISVIALNINSNVSSLQLSCWLVYGFCLECVLTASGFILSLKNERTTRLKIISFFKSTHMIESKTTGEWLIVNSWDLNAFLVVTRL